MKDPEIDQRYCYIFLDSASSKQFIILVLVCALPALVVVFALGVFGPSIDSDNVSTYFEPENNVSLAFSRGLLHHYVDAEVSVTFNSLQPSSINSYARLVGATNSSLDVDVALSAAGILRKPEADLPDGLYAVAIANQTHTLSCSSLLCDPVTVLQEFGNRGNQVLQVSIEGENLRTSILEVYSLSSQFSLLRLFIFITTTLVTLVLFRYFKHSADSASAQSTTVQAIPLFLIAVVIFDRPIALFSVLFPSTFFSFLEVLSVDFFRSIAFFFALVVASSITILSVKLWTPLMIANGVFCAVLFLTMALDSFFRVFFTSSFLITLIFGLLLIIYVGFFGYSVISSGSKMASIDKSTEMSRLFHKLSSIRQQNFLFVTSFIAIYCLADTIVRFFTTYSGLISLSRENSTVYLGMYLMVNCLCWFIAISHLPFRPIDKTDGATAKLLEPLRTGFGVDSLSDLDDAV